MMQVPNGSSAQQHRPSTYPNLAGLHHPASITYHPKYPHHPRYRNSTRPYPPHPGTSSFTTKQGMVPIWMNYRPPTYFESGMKALRGMHRSDMEDTYRKVAMILESREHSSIFFNQFRSYSQFCAKLIQLVTKNEQDAKTIHDTLLYDAEKAFDRDRWFKKTFKAFELDSCHSKDFVDRLWAATIQRMGELLRYGAFSKDTILEMIQCPLERGNPVPKHIEMACELLSRVGDLLDQGQTSFKLDTLLEQFSQKSHLSDRIVDLIENINESRRCNWKHKEESKECSTERRDQQNIPSLAVLFRFPSILHFKGN